MKRFGVGAPGPGRGRRGRARGPRRGRADGRAVGATTNPVAVMQGYGFGLTWQELNEAAIAIHRGAHWVATNDDPTRPTDRGLVPGNGAAVAAVRAGRTAEPEVAGKPYRPLIDDTSSRLGAQPAALRRRPAGHRHRRRGQRRAATACWCSAARTVRASCCAAGPQVAADPSGSGPDGVARAAAGPAGRRAWVPCRRGHGPLGAGPSSRWRGPPTTRSTPCGPWLSCAGVPPTRAGR